MSTSFIVQPRQFVSWNILAVVFLPICTAFFRCFSVPIYYANDVTSCCNKSSFTFFNEVLDSLYWCSYVILSSGELSFPFFSCYIQSLMSFGCKAFCIIIDFVLWFICLSFSFVHLKNGPEYLTNVTCPGVFPFDEISAAELGLEKLFRSF